MESCWNRESGNGRLSSGGGGSSAGAWRAGSVADRRLASLGTRGRLAGVLWLSRRKPSATASRNSDVEEPGLSHSQRIEKQHDANVTRPHFPFFSNMYATLLHGSVRRRLIAEARVGVILSTTTPIHSTDYGVACNQVNRYTDRTSSIRLQSISFQPSSASLPRPGQLVDRRCFSPAPVAR